MVSGRPIPLPARRPAPKLVTSSAQPQQKLASALSELRLAKLSGSSAGGLRHEPVPAPPSIDRPSRGAPSLRPLPFRAPWQLTVLRVPISHRFDRLLLVSAAHCGCKPNHRRGQGSDSGDRHELDDLPSRCPAAGCAAAWSTHMPSRLGHAALGDPVEDPGFHTLN
jgi:hypothetical protein